MTFLLEKTVNNPHNRQLVAVRKEISLKGGDPIYLFDKLEKFIRECYYTGFGSNAFRRTSYTIKDDIMYLEGSRPLLASEAIDLQKGLFDDNL